MSEKTRSRVAWASWVTAMVLLAGGASLYIPNELVMDEVFNPQMLLVPGYATVGALVASRTRNRIGWLFLALGLVAGVTLFAGQLDERAQLAGWDYESVRPIAAWLGNWTWPLNYALLGMSLLLFPDGRLPSPRWRWLAWAFAVSWALLILGTVFQSEQHTLGDGGAVANPFAIEEVDRLLQSVAPFVLPVALGGLAGVVVAPLVRYRRADREQQQQIKWLAAVLAGCFAFVALSVASLVISEAAAETILNIPMVGLTIGVPSAVGMAILRYRLYEIDVVINRALVYASLSAVLAATYLLMVVALQGILSSFTKESDLAVAGSTLAVAALFRPLRARVQAFIDRRFYRKRYDAAETLGRFSTHLRDHVDLDSLSSELVSVVGSTMQPAHVSLWLREGTT
jgi:hypothetical protein